MFRFLKYVFVLALGVVILRGLYLANMDPVSRVLFSHPLAELVVCEDPPQLNGVTVIEIEHDDMKREPYGRKVGVWSIFTLTDGSVSFFQRGGTLYIRTSEGSCSQVELRPNMGKAFVFEDRVLVTIPTVREDKEGNLPPIEPRAIWFNK